MIADLLGIGLLEIDLLLMVDLLPIANLLPIADRLPVAACARINSPMINSQSISNHQSAISNDPIHRLAASISSSTVSGSSSDLPTDRRAPIRWWRSLVCSRPACPRG